MRHCPCGVAVHDEEGVAHWASVYTRGMSAECDKVYPEDEDRRDAILMELQSEEPVVLYVRCSGSRMWRDKHATTVLSDVTCLACTVDRDIRE